MMLTTEHHNDWLGKCSASLPAIDLLLLCMLFFVIAGTSLWIAVNHYILPIEKVQISDTRRLDASYRRLERMAELNGETAPDITIPGGTESVDANLLRLLRRIGMDADVLSKGADKIDSTTERLLVELLREQTGRQLGFWNKQAESLCELNEPRPVAPVTPINAGLDNYLVLGHALAEYREQIWDQYERCVVSVKKIIGEDLLRFKYDRYDSFDMSAQQVERAKQEVYYLLGQYSELRNIYVEGHTDPVGGEAYNYSLSFNRAMYVAGIIRDHLDNQGLREGKDYFLTIAGYSERRKLSRKPGESRHNWYSRLRRIELGFQRILPGTGNQGRR